jgi:hypothetical protein
MLDCVEIGRSVQLKHHPVFRINDVYLAVGESIDASRALSPSENHLIGEYRPLHWPSSILCYNIGKSEEIAPFSRR